MTTPLWARLDTRHFVTLSEVARTGSFTATAAALGYTQSAISQQIARLEGLIGHTVVVRHPGARTVSLTPAGRILLQHADSLVATMQRASADIGALTRGLAGILRIGCFESVGGSILPAALVSFQESFPQIQISLTELVDDGDLLDRLLADDLDLTFVVHPVPAGPFVTRTLVDDPYRLVVADGPGMAALPGEVDLDQHPDLPLAGYAGMREVHSLEHRLDRPAYGQRVVFRSNSNATLLALARVGHVAAIMPQLAVPPDHPGLRVLALHDVAPRVVGMAWHRDRPLSQAAVEFVDAVDRAARTES